jgi:hypothetical protein
MARSIYGRDASIRPSARREGSVEKRTISETVV